ncbi:hypothetical protein J3R30DRAFT_3679810 [Lentinula aciculospora]|uniref:Uncharacterized protein n=1 Tax=Lentinula aciculospora TaxID=153920 RepID=A0A9W9AR07_9AGAR|nr:hypothetical protein J3R30DRAFT_3679810 [Lentinula aciculospora]
MRFITALLPLITLAVHVAATNSQGENGIELGIIRQPRPKFGNPERAPAIPISAVLPAHHGTETATGRFHNLEALQHRPGRGSCSDVLEQAKKKAKAIIAKRIKAPANALIAVVRNSLKDTELEDVGIALACFVLVGAEVGIGAIIIKCNMNVEWCNNHNLTFFAATRRNEVPAPGTDRCEQLTLDHADVCIHPTDKTSASKTLTAMIVGNRPHAKYAALEFMLDR